MLGARGSIEVMAGAELVVVMGGGRRPFLSLYVVDFMTMWN